MPIGWPMAIAPPFTLTWSGPTPRSRMDWMATAANASLISIRSRSATVSPALPSARSIAWAGWECSELSGPGDHAVRADLGEHRRPGGRGRFRRHHHDRARAVGDLRGRARGDRAVGAERGAEPAQRLHGGVGPHALVGVERRPGRRAAAAPSPARSRRSSRPSLIASAARWCDRAANSSCSLAADVQPRVVPLGGLAHARRGRTRRSGRHGPSRRPSRPSRT